MFAGTTLCEVLEPRVLFSHPTFTVSFSDPNGTNTAYFAPLRANMLAAAAEWGQYFTSNVRIDIEIDFTTDTVRASGSSASQRYLRQDGAYSVYQAGVAAKLTTGIDVNGAAADAVITLGENYLQNELWIDPDPTSPTTPVPADKTDIYSVFLHEFGHVLGIIGYRDGYNGSIVGQAETSYDASTSLDKGTFYFTGPTATNWYGQNVPLTFGNISHVGNADPNPGADISTDLMNGVAFARGTRYTISGLDLAILQDTGIPLALFPWGVATGIVFFDTNHNGIADRREPGLAGWRVYADLNGNGLPDAGEPSAVTDGNGRFVIAGVHTGRYVLRAYGKKHWTLTGPGAGYAIVRALAGHVTAAPLFGLYNSTTAAAIAHPRPARATANASVLQIGSYFDTYALPVTSAFPEIPLIADRTWLTSWDA